MENQIPDTMAARGMTREQVLNEVLLAKQPTRKFVQPEEVAALAVFLCRDEAQNINVVALYPWLMLPVVPVFVVVLAFNFFGDGLRDAADPYK